MTRCHLLNPLDALFLAIDGAWRRCGYPGAEIHWYCELKGEIDVPGLCRALQALYRLYPATAGRLTRSGCTGRITWRLDGGPIDPQRAVSLRALDPPTDDELHRQIELLLNSRLDPAARPPLQFTIFRGRPAGDFLVLRWPHALMDAHGAATIVATLLRLYEERPDPRTLDSLGDERRTDFGVLGPPLSLPACLRLLGRGAGSRRTRVEGTGTRRCRRGAWRDIRPGAPACGAGAARVRFYVRRLSREQYAQVRATAIQVCGLARTSDFVRACAICALHEVLGAPAAPESGYSTLLLVDNRRRRDPTPVCHNVFSTLPVLVRSTIAADRRRVADLFQDAAAQTLRPGVLERRLAGLTLLARVPTGILARLLAHALRAGRSPLPIGLIHPPSLPLTFMHLFPRPLKTFCGAELVNLFGARPGIPADRLVVNVSTAQERMNISGIWIEPCVPRRCVEAFLDRFVALLTDPR